MEYRRINPAPDPRLQRLWLSLTLFVCATLITGCAGSKASSAPPENLSKGAEVQKMNEDDGAEAMDPFETSVKPLLATNCSPCHVPGGKMYERLPFDNPDVVRSKSEAILRRLKSEEDQQILLDWLGEPSGESVAKPDDR